MSQQHPTSVPMQATTDTFAVFQNLPETQNLRLVARVEIPRFDQPNKDGERLTPYEQFRLAVIRAVESDDSYVETPFGLGNSGLEGDVFMVMEDLDKPMHSVPYAPSAVDHEGIWNPEKEDDQ